MIFLIHLIRNAKMRAIFVRQKIKKKSLYYSHKPYNKIFISYNPFSIPIEKESCPAVADAFIFLITDAKIASKQIQRCIFCNK